MHQFSPEESVRETFADQSEMIREESIRGKKAIQKEMMPISTYIKK